MVPRRDNDEESEERAGVAAAVREQAWLVLLRPVPFHYGAGDPLAGVRAQQKELDPETVVHHLTANAAAAHDLLLGPGQGEAERQRAGDRYRFVDLDTCAARPEDCNGDAGGPCAIRSDLRGNALVGAELYAEVLPLDRKLFDH